MKLSLLFITHLISNIMLRNLSIDEFKAATKTTAIDIVRNPNTKKLFASAAGKNYRVQGKDAKAGELDINKPIG